MALTYVTFEQLPGLHHAALFVVDYHLNNPPDFGHSLEVQYINQETMIMFAPQGVDRKRFKHCYYRVGRFADIRVVWPMKWIAPSANAYGWLPKLEFGDPNSGPYYNGINPTLVNPIQPFRYVAHDGTHVLPAAPA